VERRSLGKTNLIGTPLRLGLAALGRPGYINLGHAEDPERDYEVAHMEVHTHAVLDEAYAAASATSTPPASSTSPATCARSVSRGTTRPTGTGAMSWSGSEAAPQQGGPNGHDLRSAG
jgi:hypothetical protein